MAFYSSGGINWCWYAEIEINDGKATILLHDRLHRFEHPKHPTAIGQFRFVEEMAGRRVTHVDINETGQWPPVRYEVANPGYVFGYPNFDPKEYVRQF